MVEKIFSYSLFQKLIYRYANIPATLILTIYLLPIVFAKTLNTGSVIYGVFIALMIFLINRHYFFLYRTLPFSIKTEDDKIICKDFFLSNRQIEFKYEDIISLSGGLFAGKVNGLMKILNKDGKIICFFQKLNNAKIFETILLNKVTPKVYTEATKFLNLNDWKDEKNKPH